MILTFEAIALKAGFVPNLDGKFSLPATQETADKLGAAALALLPEWQVGDPAVEATITGAAPVWGWLCIAHSLHGRVSKLIYAAPNAPEIVIYSHS
jgi:hypothetical protein